MTAPSKVLGGASSSLLVARRENDSTEGEDADKKQRYDDPRVHRRGG